MIKYRIGIIGTENFHAKAFSEQFNKPDSNGNFKYPDFRVTLVYGHYDDQNKLVAETYGASVAESIEEMVKNVDAVMITARDGKFHAEFAKPFIEAGIPAFIDKPFTTDSDTAKELIALAKQKGVPILAGSSLKFIDGVQELKQAVKSSEKVYGGCVSAPVAMDSEYSGFYFYASHLVEMTLEIFGYNPKKVSAVKTDKGICANIFYDDFIVTNQFNDGLYKYGIMANLKEGVLFDGVDDSAAFSKECENFVNMLRLGKMTHTYEEYIIPVFYMNAVEEAYKTGKTVEIKY